MAAKKVETVEMEKKVAMEEVSAEVVVDITSEKAEVVAVNDGLGNDARAMLARPKRTFKRWLQDALRAIKNSLGYAIIIGGSVALFIYMLIMDFFV